MALVVWTKTSGYSLGTFQERTTPNIILPVVAPLPTGVVFKVISGSLPPGLRISGSSIVGTPYEVPRETTFEFCIRASNSQGISDRTFFITIQGADEPEFVTPEGDLKINQNQLQYFVLDSSYVDFQIEAFDRDISTGQTLSFFIADDDGILPPGLTLSKSGKISGLVEPAFSIKPEDGDGTYDTGYFDAVAYDFAYKPSNGYDSYIYDSVFFDYSVPSARPKKLNKNYEFIVTMTDGDSVAKRKFRIFVVGDDYFRADNTGLFDSNGLFTADATYLRSPIWLTPSNLGLYRANNYVTLILDTYDTNQVLYNLEEINADISATTLRKTSSDNNVGTYSVTIKNTKTKPQVGQYFTFGGLFSITDALTGEIILPDYRKYHISYVSDLGNNEYRLTTVQPLQLNLPNNVNFYIGDLGELPPGMNFDANTGEVFGVVPYQPAITKEYRFTVSATRFSEKTTTADYVVHPINEGLVETVIRIDKNLYPKAEATLQNQVLILVDSNDIENFTIDYTDPNEIVINLITPIELTAESNIDIQYLTAQGEYAKSPRVFNISIIGEVESVMTWISPGDLGSINANYVSTLKVEATSSIDGATVIYHKVSGSLPPGLTLNLDGEIIGKANQFYNELTEELGLTRFFDQPPQVPDKIFTEFTDGTTIDRSYSFTVEAKDQFGYSATTKTFTIKVDTPNSVIYGNLRTKPFLKLDQRTAWKNFIRDTSIFTTNSIYRPNDPNFGVQEDLSMLIYAGIETTEAAAYVSAMGLNHKRKQFQFGSVKKATAVIPGTTDQVYEVVYVEMIDPSEPDKKRLPNKLEHLGLRSAEITSDLSNAIWLSGYPKDDPLTDEQQQQENNMSQEGNPTARPDPILTIDSTGYEISNPKTSTYYPNSVSNWRDRFKSSFKIKNNGDQVALKRERNYLPLWMRSIQPGTKQELDFQLAVPLCYCKVGTADDIILNIKYSGFDFKNIDFTADRYIIDSVEDEVGDKYLVFRNDRITV